MKKHTEEYERKYDGSGEASQNQSTVAGRNPVMEALKSGRAIEKIMIAKGAEGSIHKIKGIAKERGIPIHYAEKQALDRAAEGAKHQGVVAFVSAHVYCEPEDILRLAQMRREAPFVLVLDGVEDPRNLGAIIRTAEGAGVHGIILPKRRAAGITPAAVKASAGASEYMLCARVPNLARAIDDLKENGLWIFACDVGGAPYHAADFTGAAAIVVGNESAGIGKGLKAKCDFTCAIPMKGKIQSLNAGNAAAIILYEARRQRDAAAFNG